MEAALAPAPEQVTPVAVAQTADARKMFRYSAYVHVGDGAEECEHATDGECKDVEHFHAWCRLPNPFQHQDIREKGLAAKARKVRELRDPESNASVLLDQRLELLHDEAFRSQVTDELLAQEWASDYLEAIREVEAEEEFEHIGQDREELARQAESERKLPAEQQSEEYKRLDQHVRGYVDAVNAAVDRIQAPKREQYDSRPFDALVAIVRANRVDSEGDRVFMDVYAAWTWFVGTFKVAKHKTLGRPHLPMWDEIGVRDRPAAGTMFGEAPEVIDALRDTFDELHAARQQGSSGNP